MSIIFEFLTYDSEDKYMMFARINISKTIGEQSTFLYFIYYLYYFLWLILLLLNNKEI